MPKEILIEKGISKIMPRELVAIVNWSLENDVAVRTIQSKDFNINSDSIPFGSVKFIQEIIGKIEPDYFPFSRDLAVKRDFSENSDKVVFPNLGEIDIFIKPSDEYKRFDGYILPKGESPNHPSPYFIQEVVKWGNEWRAYITNGKIADISWYKGPNEEESDTVPYELPKEWLEYMPSKWCGTIDFGETDKGLQMVECHHPFSIGWYGGHEDFETYAEFIIAGWDYMCKYHLT